MNDPTLPLSGLSSVCDKAVVARFVISIFRSKRYFNPWSGITGQDTGCARNGDQGPQVGTHFSKIGCHRKDIFDQFIKDIP